MSRFSDFDLREFFIVCAVCFLFLLPSISFAGELYSYQLNEVRLVDLTRLILTDTLKKSFSISPELLADNSTLTVDLHDLDKTAVVDFLQENLKGRGFELSDRGMVTFVQRIQKPIDDVLVYHPRFRSAKYLGDVVGAVAGEKTLTTRLVSEPPMSSPAPAASSSVSPSSQASPVPDTPGTAAALISKADIDQLAFRCSKERCAIIRSLLEQVDTPTAQVLLKAAVYEVQTARSEGSALQLVSSLFGGRLKLSTPSQALGYSGELVAGGIDAVISSLDSDGHFKSLSKPFLRVVSGTSARFEVGEQVPVLSNVTQAANGSTMQGVQYMSSGTIFTVAPDVREDAVFLNVTQELSSFVQTTTGVNSSPTLTQRKANSQLMIKSGEVAVMAGLESNQDSDSSSGLFGFHLSNAVSNSRNEILIFIEAQRI
ncbi:type II secretion system protein D precursor [mine drainage metagenome]|uniref:Type II secretion system protein D n=1 Tax=mine drainage metagenome TaxID=410659 RepID=A0A1J5TAX5_9ZZZZ